MEEKLKVKIDEDGCEIAKCWWCEDEMEIEELYHTTMGALCEHCIAYLRSRGEKMMVGEPYYCPEDDEVEYVEELD